MTKGRILLFIVAFFVTMGWPREAQASMNASSCSSMMVSTPLCDELLSQTCFLNKEEEIPQIQSSLIISSPKATVTPQAISVQSEALSTPTLTNPAPSTAVSLRSQPGSLALAGAGAQSAPTQTEPTAQITNLDSDRIFDLINQHRASQGLTPFELEASVCELAQERSTELAGELVNGTIHSGLYNRNLPYWIWENAKVGSSEDETVAWWLSSPLHHQSIVGDYKYSCVKCQGTNCTQLFTSLVAK